MFNNNPQFITAKTNIAADKPYTQCRKLIQAPENTFSFPKTVLGFSPFNIRDFITRCHFD